MTVENIENIIKNVTPYIDGLIKRDLIERDLTILQRKHTIHAYQFAQGSPKEYLQQAKDRQVQVDFLQISRERFEQYMRQVDYDKNYPEYRKTYQSEKLLRKKALEHYLSLEVKNVVQKKCLLDVGVGTSPFGKIAQRFFGFENYYLLDFPRADLGIKPGVHGSLIGSNADNIPLPDETVDFVVSHNAIEHFDGSSYSGFLKEAMRILVHGGNLVVLPLFYSRETFSYTSLHRWYRDKQIPSFIDQHVVVREDISQPYSRHVSITTLCKEFIDQFRGSSNIKIIYFENFKEIEDSFPFALWAKKF